MSDLSELGDIIDRTCDANSAKELETIIATNSEYVESLNDSIEKVYGYFLLGNAYNGVKKTKHKENLDTVWSLEQEEVFQEIYYFRKAKLQNSFQDSDITTQIAVNVNLGNAFNHYGRTVNAIKYFNNATGLKFFDKNVAYHPNFILANLNKALAFEYYAKLEYDHNHAFIFSQFSYKVFKETIELLTICLQKYRDEDDYYKNIKNTILKKIEDYEKHWNIKDLEDLSYVQNYEVKYSTNEKTYRDWCLQNRLFLNPLNELGNYQIASHDPLNLPTLTTDINDGFPRFITYFNQMKQEYITYRHLLFEGLSKKTQKFYDKETSITDDYDYNLYSLDIEKIKLAYRGFYSIFDKIAYFMNEYFKIGLSEANIDFRKIWYEYGKDRRTIKKN